MTSMRLARAAAAALLPLALLAGCSDDADPTEDPTTPGSTGTATGGGALTFGEQVEGEDVESSVSTVDRRCRDLGRNYITFAQLDVSEPIDLTDIGFANGTSLQVVNRYVSPTDADDIPRSGMAIDSIPRRTKQHVGWKLRQRLDETLHLDPGHYTWYLEFQPSPDPTQTPHFDGITITWKDADGAEDSATYPDDTTFNVTRRC